MAVLVLFPPKPRDVPDQHSVPPMVLTWSPYDSTSFFHHHFHIPLLCSNPSPLHALPLLAIYRSSRRGLREIAVIAAAVARSMLEAIDMEPLVLDSLLLWTSSRSAPASTTGLC